MTTQHHQGAEASHFGDIFLHQKMNKSKEKTVWQILCEHILVRDAQEHDSKGCGFESQYKKTMTRIKRAHVCLDDRVPTQGRS